MDVGDVFGALIALGILGAFGYQFVTYNKRHNARDNAKMAAFLEEAIHRETGQDVQVAVEGQTAPRERTRTAGEAERPPPADPDDVDYFAPPPKRPWKDQPGVAQPFDHNPFFHVSRFEQKSTVAATIGPGESGQFKVTPADALPTFADLGGMEDTKAELRDTVGLLIEHADEAAKYGITWNGVLLHGPPGVGKTFFAKAAAGELGLNLLHVSTGDLVSSFVGESARNVQKAFETAEQHRPCVLFFDEFDSIAGRRDATPNQEDRRAVNQLLQSLEEHRGYADLVVMAATNSLEALDPAVIRAGRFDRHVRVDRPDDAARRSVFRAQLADRLVADGVDLADLARRTRGLTPAEIAQTVERASLAAFKEAAASGDEVHITMEHLLAAVRDRGGADRPTVEDWTWDRIVLPDEVVAELQQLEALIEDPELVASMGIDPPSGVLLAGPPGTGKTTIARVLAAQTQASFYPVSAADVSSKWAGESEQRIAQLFERARANRPSIVFIDEIDAIGATRGGADWSSRQLNQLLHEMDGLEPSSRVFVVGATNRPDVLDPALLRGGRLSRTITIGLPDTEARLAILSMLTQRMPTVGVDLVHTATHTEGLSGADLKAVCQQAALHGLVRARQEGDGATPSVTQADLDRAIAEIRA